MNPYIIRIFAVELSFDIVKFSRIGKNHFDPGGLAKMDPYNVIFGTPDRGTSARKTLSFARYLFVSIQSYAYGENMGSVKSSFRPLNYL